MHLLELRSYFEAKSKLRIDRKHTLRLEQRKNNGIVIVPMTSLGSIPCLSLSIACSLTDLEPAALTGPAFSTCCLSPHTPTTKVEPLCPVYCSDGLEPPSP